MFDISYSLTYFEFILSLNNILLGLGLSVFIGILAGMIPASQASKMDAVVAMRQ
jgi:putative ABC transport system permease protein